MILCWPTTLPGRPSISKPNEIRKLQEDGKDLKSRIRRLEQTCLRDNSFHPSDFEAPTPRSVPDQHEPSDTKQDSLFISALTMRSQKWMTRILLTIGGEKRSLTAVLDSGADFHCLRKDRRPRVLMGTLQSGSQCG